MAKKMTNISVDNATGRSSRPSVFDKIIREINAVEIPAMFVENLFIQYFDGSVLEMSGDSITQAVPVNGTPTSINKDSRFKKVRDIKVVINVEKLESEINSMVEEHLGKYC